MFEAYYKMTTSHLGHTMLSHEDFCTPNLADEPVLLYQSLDIESQRPSMHTRSYINNPVRLDMHLHTCVTHAYNAPRRLKRCLFMSMTSIKCLCVCLPLLTPLPCIIQYSTYSSSCRNRVSMERQSRYH